MCGSRRLEYGIQRRGRGRRAARGLTLVELLVALALTVVVLGAVFGVFSATTRNLSSLERRSDLDQTARIALDQIRRDLSSLHPVQITQEAEAEAAATEVATTSAAEQQAGVTFVGEDGAGSDNKPEDILRFTATISGAAASSRRERLSAGRGDLAEVLYKLDVDEATPEHGLVRVVNWQPGLTGTESTPEVTELAPMATTFDVRYYTDVEREGADADGWCADWQDVQQVPVAVAVTLGLTLDSPGAIEEIVSLTVRLPLRGARYKPTTTREAPATETTDEPAPAVAAPAGGPQGGAGGMGGMGGGGAGGFGGGGMGGMGGGGGSRPGRGGGSGMRGPAGETR